MRSIVVFVLVVAVGFTLTGCDSVAGEVSLDTYVLPLTVSINSKGEINFTVRSGYEIPTPIGVISAGIVIDPSVKYEVPNTLTVRLNGQDHFFDLHGQDFRLEVASGYYEVINIQKRGKDLLLELNQSGNIQAGTITVPMFWQKRIEGEIGHMFLTIEKLVIKDTSFEVHVDAKSFISKEYTGQGKDVFLEDSCVHESYRKPVKVLGIALPTFSDEMDYSPLSSKTSFDTGDHAGGYVVFSRDILREHASYEFCFACDERMCSDTLPLH